jgi:aldose 1-epimerase
MGVSPACLHGRGAQDRCMAFPLSYDRAPGVRELRIEPCELGGRATSEVRLRNGAISAWLLGYGATLVGLDAPDRRGAAENVVLGFTDLERYLGPHPYFGATVGRFANRIRGASFVLDGRAVPLVANENGNQLHGGPQGFHRAWFDAAPIDGDDHVGVTFTMTSPDGDMGFPGRLDVQVVYRLYDSGALRIDFLATTDKPTVCNLTHHTYWNLGGSSSGVLDQILQIDADRYVPLDALGIPSGGTISVDGTAFDFREPRRIGERIADATLASRGGYDHPFMIRRRGGGLQHVATLRDPASGRRLDVSSTEPVLQLYTGQLLDPRETGRDPFAALCLETGQAPDCPNQPDLGSARLDPGQRYEHTAIYRLGVER